jgi:hypothetical protein
LNSKFPSINLISGISGCHECEYEDENLLAYFGLWSRKVDQRYKYPGTVMGDLSRLKVNLAHIYTQVVPVRQRSVEFPMGNPDNWTVRRMYKDGLTPNGNKAK